MNKKLLTLFFAFFAIATTARAQVVLNETNFPDANFRASLARKFRISEGDEITAEKIAATTSLNFYSKSIADLTGIEHFIALTELDCSSFQLTSLDVSKNTKLTSLTCHSNQIKGEAMDALVASLPAVNYGFFSVIDTKDENEGNICTKTQVVVAKEKGWKVNDYNGGFLQEYEGSDEANSIGASLNDNGKITNDNYYSIDGVKLNGEPTKKGVYIYNVEYQNQDGTEYKIEVNASTGKTVVRDID